MEFRLPFGFGILDVEDCIVFEFQGLLGILIVGLLAFYLPDLSRILGFSLSNNLTNCWKAGMLTAICISSYLFITLHKKLPKTRSWEDP